MTNICFFFTTSLHITTITYITVHSLNNKKSERIGVSVMLQTCFRDLPGSKPKKVTGHDVFPLIILQHLSSNSGTLHAPGHEGVLPINFQLIIILLIDTTHSELLKSSLKGQRQNQFSLYTSKSSDMECGVKVLHILLHHYFCNTILVL